ncbi:hypothetical protein BS47DRAFT_1247059, partial [Hydnum rufescens UP504]
VLCLDACFEQQQCKGVGLQDIRLDLPRTCFLLTAEVEKARLYVESLHPTQGKRGRKKLASELNEFDEEDWVEPGLHLPNSVVNGCETSFKVANENCEKASTTTFASTGLMAAICR